MYKFLKHIDKNIFNGFIRKIYSYFSNLNRFRVEKKSLNVITNQFSDNYSVLYNRRPNLLAILCDKYGSDKGNNNADDKSYDWDPHTYTDYYYSLFSHCRNSVSSVFECGIGTNDISLRGNMGINGNPGASLRVWKDYFPNALIIGADIDKNILFSEDRIETYYVDQTSQQSIKNMWNKVSVDKFDLMIDDGLHTYEGGVSLFENSINYLSEYGLYIIEDVKVSDLSRYEKYFEDRFYIVEFVNLHRKGQMLLDNSLIVIRK